MKQNKNDRTKDIKKSTIYNHGWKFSNLAISILFEIENKTSTYKIITLLTILDSLTL